MKKIKLFENIYIDLPKLIATKLFIYANSGFGKSWLLRWFLEQTFTQIQQIIIDPEGEFSTLREKFDYVLIGKGKDFDIQADPRTASLLAHRLLEEKVSAIIDLYELEPLAREQFVANFSTALVNAPKNLWHPYLYVVDEAQDFAPEKGDSLASKPLHSIAKKGRKRGCCPVFATQRVSDFSKAVIAACNNKLIGQASLDIDMKRCAAELGFTTREQMLSLRDLEPGEFFSFGPAISKIVRKVKIGAVKTSHPDSSKMGAKIGTKVVPASPKVKKALAALADLPQEAEAELKTTAELKTALTTAKRRIVELERAPKNVTVPSPIIKGITEKEADQRIRDAMHKRDLEWEKVVKGWVNYSNKIRQFLIDIWSPIKKWEETQGSVKPPMLPKGFMTPSNLEKVVLPFNKEIEKHHAFVRSGKVIKGDGIKLFEQDHRAVQTVATPDGAPLQMSPGKGEEAVLNAIAQDPEGITNEHLAVLTGYKTTSRRVYTQRLSQMGLIAKQGDVYVATEAGIEFLGERLQVLPTGDALLEHFMQTLPDGEKKVLKVVAGAFPEPISKEAIQEATSYKVTSVRVYLQRLGARKAVVPVSNGMVIMSDKLSG